jgi:glutamyl-tRNA(Gln) amidotransferase subunit E
VTFASEFADRVRVIACPEHRPFLIHSDLSDYGLSPRQWRNLEKRLNVERGDAVVVVWAPEPDAATAVRELFIRARDALVGVPAETRQAFSDGTNGFERILPGADRMYPDTDTPPLPIADRLVAEVRKRLPETPWARRERYERMGLEPSAAHRLSRAPWAQLFEALEPKKAETARRLAAALEKRIPHHRRRRGLEGLPDPERLKPMVDAIEAGEIRIEAIERILDAVLEQPARRVDELLAPFRARGDDEKGLERRVREVAERAGACAGTPPDAFVRWAMGEIMPGLIGRLEPSRVRERILETVREAVPEGNK